MVQFVSVSYFIDHLYNIGCFFFSAKMASKIVFILLVALTLCLFVDAGKAPKKAAKATKGKSIIMNFKMYMCEINLALI